MPDYPYIDRYHRELAELIEFGGADNEENIRQAFQNCLAAYCAEQSERLVLVPELRADRSNKTRRHSQGLPAHDARLVGKPRTPTMIWIARSETN